mgnify:CR=1 FL=1
MPGKRSAPLPIRSELAGRILARLYAIHYWPFKDKQFAGLIVDMPEEALELLGYCSINSTDEDFKRRIKEALNAKFPNQ